MWHCKSGTVRHNSSRPSGCRASKYLELQEVWEQVGATSVLSIPIPAVRNYESASIVEAPAADKPAPEAASESAPEPSSDPAPELASHVLHNSNGAIGIVTVGLATEKIDLNGRCASVSVQCIFLVVPAGVHCQFGIPHDIPISACTFNFY